MKIRCDAFVSRKLAPKAELAKDICAMANNGNVASYIVIGVSDDGQSFQSVSNPKLTEENLQSFCKTAVFPPPKVKVHRQSWLKAAPAHRAKEFVIIQIGPHARQAFRLSRDFISHQERICYRRNEVWIRRGPTSDLATPEEITRLVKGQPPEDRSKPEENVEYARLPRDEQPKAMLKDFQQCVADIGGCLYKTRVVVPFGNLRYVWRYIFLRDCTGKLGVWDYVSSRWEYEHGVLFLVTGTVSKQAFQQFWNIHFKKKWGLFTYYEYHKDSYFFSGRARVPLPVNTKEFPLITLTLPNLTDTEALRSSFHDLLQFLDTDQDASKRIRLARQGVNYNLSRWLRQGWLISTRSLYFGDRPRKSELGENEFFSRRYGDVVLRREKSKALRNMAQTVLDLSAGRLP